MTTVDDECSSQASVLNVFLLPKWKLHWRPTLGYLSLQGLR